MRKFLGLFTGFCGTGGIQKYNRDLCAGFASGFPQDRFTVVSLLDRTNESLELGNIKVKLCNRLGIKAASKAVFFIKAVSECLFNRPDLLICAHVDLLPVALFCKKIFGLRYIVFAYGIDSWELKSGVRYKGLERADKVITISRFTKGRLVRNGIDERKILILPNAIDMALFRPKKPEEKLKKSLGLDNRIVLLTVGRLNSQERYKGHDIMLSVMQNLDGRYVWLVVGGGDDLLRLRQKAESLSLGQRVRFLGEIDDNSLIDYYNLCDIFVMPSRGEGFGVVFLEALACGKPVIAGKDDGSTEPLEDGKLGFLINPASALEIIQAIHLASANNEPRTDSEYLISQVEACFSKKVFNQRVKDILKALGF